MKKRRYRKYRRKRKKPSSEEALVYLLNEVKVLKSKNLRLSEENRINSDIEISSRFEIAKNKTKYKRTLCLFIIFFIYHVLKTYITIT